MFLVGTLAVYVIYANVRGPRYPKGKDHSDRTGSPRRMSCDRELPATTTINRNQRQLPLQRMNSDRSNMSERSVWRASKHRECNRSRKLFVIIHSVNGKRCVLHRKLEGTDARLYRLRAVIRACDIARVCIVWYRMFAIIEKGLRLSLNLCARPRNKTTRREISGTLFQASNRARLIRMWQIKMVKRGCAPDWTVG